MVEITDEWADELRLSAKMIRKWAPETFPDNENGQVHFARATMESVAETIEKALSAALSTEPAMKVKPLVWEQVSPRCWDSDGMGKLYRVLNREDGSADLKNNQFERGDNYPDLEAAKAAAQADFDQRIRSALIPAQAETGEPVAWQWRALESGEPKTAWKGPTEGDRPGWEALAQRNPDAYSIEKRLLYLHSAPAHIGEREALEPCGIADPSTRDCPNMKEVGGGMDGERYKCAVCGKGYFLDYEDMK